MYHLFITIIYIYIYKYFILYKIIASPIVFWMIWFNLRDNKEA